ncbi:MAG TPA: hypothetical protein VEC99_06495 [Clostridia bacterium]|nr:hypothetical protein [Clostridia bacterium]
MNPTLAGLLFDIMAFFATLVAVVILLDVIWCREQVKKDLRARCCGPIHVRWHPYPFGYWAGASSRPFKATFVDPSGCIQSGRCKVLPLSRTVVWVSDEVEYLDKQIPLFWRMVLLLVAICLCFFGLHHLYTGSLTIPAWLDRRGRGDQIQGWSLYLLALASLFWAANVFATALFRQMGKKQERMWILFARAMALIAWLLFWSSLAALYAGLGSS